MRAANILRQSRSTGTVLDDVNVVERMEFQDKLLAEGSQCMDLLAQHHAVLQHALYRGAPRYQRFHLEMPSEGVSMQVKQIMSQPVATCRSNDPLHIAAQRMWDSDCGVVPVVNDEGCAVAMITDRDICMAAYTQGKPLAEIEVRSAMSHELYSCGPNDSLQEVEEMMRSHSIRRVPVLDEVGRPVGIVSMNDLARISMKQHPSASAGGNGVTPSSVARTLSTICAPRLRELNTVHQ